MKLTRFTIATLAPLFIGSPLVAQQPSTGQPASGQNQAAQSDADQGQPLPGQSNQERDTERNPAQRDSAERNATQRGAAERGSTQRGAAERSGQQDAQAKNRAIAECLAIMNREQVLIARYATENASSEDVKEFAAMLKKDHQSCLGELQKAFSQDGEPAADSSKGQEGQRTASANRESNTQDRVRSASTDRDSNAQDRVKRASEDRGANAQDRVKRASAETASNAQDGANEASHETASHAGGYQDSSVSFVQLRREVSEQVLKDTHETLSSKDGAEFDKCFVGMQVAKHGMMKSGLTVLGRHASGDLSGLIEKSIEKNGEHLKASEDLMRQLVKNDSKESNERSN